MSFSKLPRLLTTWRKTSSKLRAVFAKKDCKCFGGSKLGRSSLRQELNRRLSRSPATLTRWLAAYRNGGLSALLEEKKAPGAAPKIQGEALEKLQQRLASEENFSSYGSIVKWLKQECGLDLIRYGQSLCEPEVKD